VPEHIAGGLPALADVGSETTEQSLDGVDKRADGARVDVEDIAGVFLAFVNVSSEASEKGLEAIDEGANGTAVDVKNIRSGGCLALGGGHGQSGGRKGKSDECVLHIAEAWSDGVDCVGRWKTWLEVMMLEEKLLCWMMMLNPWRSARPL
jgi:hypothetical protein